MSKKKKSADKARELFSNWKVHGVVLVLVVISEFIGIHSFKIGPGTMLLLPMLYALVIGMFLGPRYIKIVNQKEMEAATPLVMLSVLLLVAKLGFMVGPNIPALVSAGLPLLAQELGNFGTLLIGLPIAILLGFKREAIGATFSNAREGALAIIGDIYGLDSPEGLGVLGVYISGTILGAIYNGLMGGFVASLGWFHPYAVGMACGVGSASMMSACSGAAAAALPQYSDQILSFAAASNLITTATGLYAMLFIALPLANVYYRLFRRDKTPRKPQQTAAGA